MSISYARHLSIVERRSLARPSTGRNFRPPTLAMGSMLLTVVESFRVIFHCHFCICGGVKLFQTPIRSRMSNSDKEHEAFIMYLSADQSIRQIDSYLANNWLVEPSKSWQRRYPHGVDITPFGIDIYGFHRHAQCKHRCTFKGSRPSAFASPSALPAKWEFGGRPPQLLHRSFLAR